MASASNMGLQELVDTLSRNIRDKVATDTGYADVFKQVNTLKRILTAADGAKADRINFEDFGAALVRVNVVGNQRGVKALFERYDSDGDGLLVVDEFCQKLLGVVPDTQNSGALRNMFGALRRGIGKSLGLHGVRHMEGILASAASLDGESTISVTDFTVLASELGMRAADIAVIVAEMDLARTGRLAIPIVVEGVRGVLTRYRRQLLEAAWETITGGTGSTSVEGLAAVFDGSMDARVVAGRLSAADVAAEMRVCFGSDASFDAFLVHGHNVSAVIEDDAAFAKTVEAMWGARTTLERSALVMPGTVEHIVRTARTAHSSATPRGGSATASAALSASFIKTLVASASEGAGDFSATLTATTAGAKVGGAGTA